MSLNNAAQQIIDQENFLEQPRYEVFMNEPNKVVLNASFDLGPDINTPKIAGMRGDLNYLEFSRIALGKYAIRLKNIDSNKFYVGDPATARVSNANYSFDYQRIKQVNIGLQSWNFPVDYPNTVAPAFGLYWSIWYYNPIDFPTEMSTSNPDFRNMIIVSFYKYDSNDPQDPLNGRVNVEVTFDELNRVALL